MSAVIFCELRDEEYSVNEELHAQIALALAICAHDGLLSDAEIASLRSTYCDTGRVKNSEMEQIIDVFFEEDKTLEELFSAVDDVDFTLQISEEAASADGLDLKENFALKRCHQMRLEKFSAGKPDAS